MKGAAWYAARIGTGSARLTDNPAPARVVIGQPGANSLSYRHAKSCMAGDLGAGMGRLLQAGYICREKIPDQAETAHAIRR